jgi:hypothetical protein
MFVGCLFPVETQCLASSFRCQRVSDAKHRVSIREMPFTLFPCSETCVWEQWKLVVSRAHPPAP